ncbi:MAG TPA: ATP-binding protein [Pseudonocardiaceae bacterium]|jgi:anti-sigma regulatory factor (Ser/Thr protein kinase)|nr:ATP-binding protein [Pseudonocardiaceae bacterium]
MTGIECRLQSVALPTAASPPLPAVRKALAPLADGLPAEVEQDLMLLVTELVANAYEHGIAPRELRVERRDGSGAIRVEVDDAAPGRPILGWSRLGVNRGRGVRIVDGLAARWGVRQLGVGKTVWAELSY